MIFESEKRWQLGDQFGMVQPLNQLISITLRQGQVDFTRTDHYYVQSLQIAHQPMDRVEIANELENLAAVANVQGNAERAIRLFGAALSLRAILHMLLSAAEQSRHQQIITVARAQ